MLGIWYDLWLNQTNLFKAGRQLNLSDHPYLNGPIPRLEDIAPTIISPIDDGPPDIIPGLLPKKGQLVIAGQTDVGKSLVALEICSSLVTGNPLWGEIYPIERAKRIVFVLGEHYVNVIKRLALYTKLPFTDQVFVLGPEQLGYDKWLVTGGKPNLVAVAKFKQWCEGADLVVFDPLSAFVTGSEAENDNIGMRLVLDTMSLITQSVGASCLILAHQGKPMMDQTGKEHSRKSYAIRGASAVEDAATNIFYMGRGVGESDAAKQATSGALFSLIRRKYKGEAPSEHRLLRDPGTLTHAYAGNRPFVELVKQTTQQRCAKLQAALPASTYADIIKMVAIFQDCSETTIRRHLGLKD